MAVESLFLATIISNIIIMAHQKTNIHYTHVYDKNHYVQMKTYLPECFLNEPEHIDVFGLSLRSLLPQSQYIDHPEPNVMTQFRKSACVCVCVCVWESIVHC